MFGLDSGVGVFITIIAMAVVFLKFFDQVAGRGSKQVKDGINKSSINKSENRCRALIVLKLSCQQQRNAHFVNLIYK